MFGLLDEDDYVSIIAFDNEVRQYLRPTRWGTISRETAVDAVADISAGGGTDMYSGLLEAKASLRMYRPTTTRPGGSCSSLFG